MRIRVIFNRKTMATNIKERIDFRKYIDEIQNTIAETAREVGIGKTKRERWRGKRRLARKIMDLSERLAAELGMGGDYNIVYMLTTGMITSAWATFILKAKSLDKRRPPEYRVAMRRMVEDMADAYDEILRQAVDYGKIYDKEVKVNGK